MNCINIDNNVIKTTEAHVICKITAIILPLHLQEELYDDDFPFAFVL